MMSQGQNLLSRTNSGLIRSFWFKLLVIMIAVVIFATLVTVGILTFTWGSSGTAMRQVFDKEMREKGYLVAKFVRAYGIPSYYEKNDFAKLQTVLQTIRTDKDPENMLYLFVKDADGKIVAQAPEDVTDSETPTGALAGVNAIPQGNAVANQYIQSPLTAGSQQQILDTAILVLPDQRAELHVGLQVGTFETPSTQVLAWVGIGVLWVVLIVVGVFGFRWFVTRQIRRPVGKVVEYVSQVGQGNLEYSLDLEVSNELDVLKESLTDMVEQLKGTVQTESDINRMQGQIMNMLSTVSAAADGNLTVEAEVTADALGSLADAFNMMVASLASLVEQVRKSATDMSSATNDILLSSAQMIKGAEEQQNHINNITSAVDEIAVSMQQVANNAEAAARASQMATEAAQKGENSVEETILGMHRIRNTVQVTSKKIKSLGDRSIEIGEITTTIEDIARQTTILALNAAIEAARAGEHGRGFGVVAEEVRKLAERSSKATQDIGDLIKGIQAETNEAVRTMEEGTREVEEGTRLADIAGNSLKDIDKSVGQVADLIQEISLAAKQQARGTDGVVRSMETISDITNLHADGVRKTTETIERLATLSDRLTEAIGNFKIRESDNGRPEPPERKAISAQPQSKPPMPQPRQEPSRPEEQSQMMPFMPPAGDMSVFTSQTDDDEDELITEEDFFKTS
jgi:methyl-accepting chemotaxis protein